ncbi:hypothetical protein [Streptomyces sp. NPDC047079]|uniref:hypothetical protein n=1 Tax=Streptomyces sp. NPDC047079 TaxID=3154607 RepID=UPI0033E7E0E2
MNITWPEAVIAVVIIVAVVAIAVTLRHRLKNASIQGYGVRANLEGTERQEPLTDQELQAHDSLVKNSHFSLVKGVRTAFFRSKVRGTVVQITSDDGSGRTPGAPGSTEPPEAR